MVEPETADGVRAAVSALRYLDVIRGVTFHVLLPDNRCIRLVVKILGKRMSTCVVCDGLQPLGICVIQLHSGRRDQNQNPKSTELVPPLKRNDQGPARYPPHCCRCGANSSGSHSRPLHPLPLQKAARSRPLVKTVVLLVAEDGSTA